MSEWKPIETAPKDGTRVLLGWTDSAVMSGIWYGAWMVAPGMSELRPTHWQDLPSPPSPKSEMK